VALSNRQKRVIRYQDLRGVERTKNCGSAESARQCISWLKREGFEFISQEIIEKETVTTKTKRPKMRHPDD